MEKVDPNRLWYVYAQDKEIGPIKEVELRHRIVTGSLTPSSYAYTESMDDWKSLSEIKIFNELFENSERDDVPKSVSDAFDKIPYASKEKKRKADRARTFLIASFALFLGAAAFYFWDPNPQVLQETAVNKPAEFPAVDHEDPFATKDWSELRNYRNRTDVVGTGFVVARDRIDEEFPVLKAAVSTNIDSGEIEYRIYPVPGAHLMPLPVVFQGKTSVVNGYFVVGPLSDGGKPLPPGKYRLIAKADHVYLGEVTLQRGHLPEGDLLQKEEENLKAARFEKINMLKASFAKRIEALEGVMRELEELKVLAALPPTDPASQKFASQARTTLEKLRNERTSVKNSEGALILLGDVGNDFVQAVENIWTPLAPAFQEFPNPSASRFVNFDSKGIRTYLNKMKAKSIKISTEEIAGRSESLLNEDMIKKSLLSQEASAR